ncbi:hypothetical protein [Nicoliella lavandulae]|uniref:Uncharacterized protein n=1 Tax=Nicoliella lavandulae TaxID=3082954 RepID=A0ABU8SM41_9LACO
MKVKKKLIGLALAGLIVISALPSTTASAKLTVKKTVPSAYHGNWYAANKKNHRELIYISNKYVITGTYSKFNLKKNQVKLNYETGYLPKNTGSTKLVIKKGSAGDGQYGTTYTFNQGDDIDEQLPTFWTSKMKISGKLQTVLKAYSNYGEVKVYTKVPVSKDYSYKIKTSNVGSEIGK